MDPPVRFDAVGLLTLREIRAFVRRSSARGGVVFFALLYVLGSLFLGGMVAIGNVGGGYSLYILWNGSSGAWNYPGLLLIAPWGVVSLPFFATLAMVVVAVGVGYGMTVAFLLVVRLLRPRATRSGGTTTASTVAGLTPAMISLVTLGACCSTTAAATAGVGLVAQASGTTTANLLLNNWYLGVFQIGMVWVALLAQEMLLIVYGGLFGRPTTGPVTSRPLTGQLVAAGALRAVLLGSAVVWALAVAAQWTTVDPTRAGVGLWAQWIGQHWVIAGLALSAALFPSATLGALGRLRHRWGGAVALVFLVLGLSVLTWVPPPLPSWGLDGFVNQILGSLAVSGWGAVPVGAVGGPALIARWLGEYLLLGGFTVAATLWPTKVGPLLTGSVPWSGSPRPAPDVESRLSGPEPRATTTPTAHGSE